LISNVLQTILQKTDGTIQLFQFHKANAQLCNIRSHGSTHRANKHTENRDHLQVEPLVRFCRSWVPRFE